MKRLSFILVLLLAGCTSSQIDSPRSNDGAPPTPPGLKLHRRVTPFAQTKSPGEAKATKAVFREVPTPVAPRWAFVRMPTNAFGNWQIEATSNLTSGVWFPVAIVYGATNVVITSDSVTKRGTLFYCVKQVK